MFSIAPLQRKWGSPRQIASLLARRQKEQGLRAQIAIAANPDTPILLAQHADRVIVADAGTEALHLAALPLSVLIPKEQPTFSALLPLLQSWGLVTCGDLARLPGSGIAERLGTAGLMLRRLAAGQGQRPLRVRSLETPYEEHCDLERALACLEPLLFLVSSVLSTLCERLRSQGCAARRLSLELSLENKTIPLPLVRVSGSARTPQGHAETFAARLRPASPACCRSRFYVADGALRTPLSAASTLLAAHAGTGSAASHFSAHSRLGGNSECRHARVVEHPSTRCLSPRSSCRRRDQAGTIEQPAGRRLQLALRVFRPALPADVRLRKEIPEYVSASAVEGHVLRASGPWKTSGEWWAATGWAHEEWDITVENGTAYCLIRRHRTREWFLRGMYD